MEGYFQKNSGIITLLSGLAVIAALTVFALQSRSPEPVMINPPLPTATPGPIQVHVAGAVVNPAIYTLPADSRVQQAIEAAGGASGDADLDRVNLAAVLSDGQQLYVPHQGEEAPAVTASDSNENTNESSGPVNINTASQAELETLPGIGPSLAQAIIEYRETTGAFSTIEEINNVSGIGPAKFETIQSLITVGP